MTSATSAIRKKAGRITSSSRNGTKSGAQSYPLHAAKKGSSKTPDLTARIAAALKNTPEQKLVVGPLVEFLCNQGWKLEQIVFGRKEWLVPKTPSECTKREKGQRFHGYPVDIAVFDKPNSVGDPKHLLFLIECKQPTEEAGQSQLESYFGCEPHVRLGVWANSADPSARTILLYRKADGSVLLKRDHVDKLPRPGEAIKPEAQRITFNDLIEPSEKILRKTVEDLLDKVVIGDSNVTRREEQLDQLCNILLLKLDSDKEGKASPDKPVFFRPMDSHARTAEVVRERYKRFVDLYPDTFTTEQDKTIRFGNETIAACVEALASLCLIDLGVSTVSVAFQVLRSEALKQGEGQYFTPNQVIQAGVRLMQIKWEDIVIDPACGTGGFLVETMLEMKRARPQIPEGELSRWAQTHIYGIEKDAIGLKLTKAIMQIAGDGSAHCVRGDSIREHNWDRDFPHLNDGRFKDGRFTVVLTNPPFGQNLKLSAADARASGYEIAKCGGANFEDLEIGLIFLERAYRLLAKGGIGIST